ncbi:SET domain protein, putative [Plasmodium relictum]|uniref:SET domain protein, putative n=1 Tax=Plasmodium relictum TaxID=85471 RepID=A0A1J1H1S8_PLARL|nr:SET domain protein, putative [Plasmodium relictum]CRG98526.1 SET domain protein, putative [Plasmodium relictum]
MKTSNICNGHLDSNDSFVNSASVIWVEKEKLDSIIHIPLYSNISKYFQDLIKDPKIQEKENILSKIFLLFDDNSCNIAIDISSLCEMVNNKIPLLIYERYYFWSLHFLFEKSKIKRQKVNLPTDFNISESIKKYNIFDDVYMYTSIYNSAYNKNEEENNISYKNCELVNNNNVNKELTIYNNDYIKYLYLNDLKNNKNTFSEMNIYTNNEIKWYRLKIKIDNVEKKKKKKNYFLNGANSYNANNFKEASLNHHNKSVYNNFNEFSLIGSVTSDNLDNLLKIKKNDNFNICNQEKNKKRNGVYNNNSSNNKKKKNWYYYESSSSCNSSNSQIYIKEDASNENYNNFCFLSKKENNYNRNNKRKSENNSNAVNNIDNRKQCKMKNILSISHNVSKRNSLSKSGTLLNNIKEKTHLVNEKIHEEYTLCKNINNTESFDSVLLKDEFLNLEKKEKEKIKINNEMMESRDLNYKEEEVKKNNGDNGIIENRQEKIIEEIKIVHQNANDDTEILIESSYLNKLNNEDYITNFKNVFSKKDDHKDNKRDIIRYNQNDSLDKYINKILKNIINKKRSHSNSLSKNFERIEAFYKQNYKIFIINNKDILSNKKFFKNNSNFYILFNEKNNSIQNDDIFELFKIYMQKEKGDYSQNYLLELKNNTKKNKNKDNEEIKINNFLENEFFFEKQKSQNKEKVNQENDNKNIVLRGENQNINKENSDNKKKCVQENQKNVSEGISKSNEENNFVKESVNIKYFNRDEHKKEEKEEKKKKEEEEVIFYAINKTDKNCKKELKEGDYIYVKFNESYDDYDKIRILNKKTILCILIYLMKNNENLKLSNISTYSPGLLWNISLHFKKNTLNLEFYLERMFKYISNDNEEDLSDICSFSEKKYSKQNSKKEYQKEMEIIKLKDNVAFLDKFLQSVNDIKLKKLKIAQKEYHEKYEFDRTINNLNKQQLIDLFIDKENEINVIPLYLLKEKSRNIIYEENIRMNMFACIKVIFDDIKGRCVYAASDLKKFDFIFEYVGELLTHNEAMKREKIYIKNKKKGCYMFYFKHDNKRYCIDGTEENIDAAINNKDKKYFLRSFARLVNHSKKNSNLIPKVLKVSSIPRLFFVASRNIKEGEELLIDYGERDKEIIKNNTWLKC